MRNAKVLYPLCKNMLISMQLVEMENKIMLKSLRTLKLLLVFWRKPLPHQIHLLKKATKVKVQGINLPLIKFLFIMINMVNLHIRLGDNLHILFVVWITIMFQDVGRKWPHTGNFQRKGDRKPEAHWTMETMLQRRWNYFAYISISRVISYTNVGLCIQQLIHDIWRR